MQMDLLTVKIRIALKIQTVYNLHHKIHITNSHLYKIICKNQYTKKMINSKCFKFLFFIAPVFILTFSSCNKKDEEKEVEVQKTKTVNLQIDGYTEGGSMNFIETVTIGEEVGITLGPVGNTFKVTSVQFLFGGTGNDPVTRSIILKIYKDDGTVIPGDLLFSSNYTIAASNSTIHEIDISDKNVTVSGGGSIRVSFEMTDETGFPSFAQEYDGEYFITKNWIKEPNGTWKSNDTFGLNGNWVIRAVIEENI